MSEAERSAYAERMAIWAMGKAGARKSTCGDFCGASADGISCDSCLMREEGSGKKEDRTKIVHSRACPIREDQETASSEAVRTVVMA